MVGQGIFRNLWFFNPKVDQATIPLHERLALLIDHVRSWQHHWTGEKHNFEGTKKFYKAYFYNVENMADLQRDLMLLRTPEETLARLEVAYAQARQPAAVRD